VKILISGVKNRLRPEHRRKRRLFAKHTDAKAARNDQLPNVCEAASLCLLSPPLGCTKLAIHSNYIVKREKSRRSCSHLFHEKTGIINPNTIQMLRGIIMPAATT
jgi:hypothetical protein